MTQTSTREAKISQAKAFIAAQPTPKLAVSLQMLDVSLDKDRDARGRCSLAPDPDVAHRRAGAPVPGRRGRRRAGL